MGKWPGCPNSCSSPCGIYGLVLNTNTKEPVLATSHEKTGTHVNKQLPNSRVRVSYVKINGAKNPTPDGTIFSTSINNNLITLVLEGPGIQKNFDNLKKYLFEKVNINAPSFAGDKVEAVILAIIINLAFIPTKKRKQRSVKNSIALLNRRIKGNYSMILRHYDGTQDNLYVYSRGMNLYKKIVNGSTIIASEPKMIDSTNGGPWKKLPSNLKYSPVAI